MHTVHKGGGQAQTSLHKSWLEGIEELSLTLQGVEPRVFGLEAWCSTTELNPPYLILSFDLYHVQISILDTWNYHFQK